METDTKAAEGTGVPQGAGSVHRFVRPWVGKLHHDRSQYADWGWIRDEAGSLIVTVPVRLSSEQMRQHRANGTDPTQQIVDAILAALNGPNA